MNRNNLNYLREDQFIELAKNGSAQDDYGITHEFAEGDLYATEDGTGGLGGLYRHIITITETSTGNQAIIHCISSDSTAKTSLYDTFDFLRNCLGSALPCVCYSTGYSGAGSVFIYTAGTFFGITIYKSTVLDTGSSDTYMSFATSVTTHTVTDTVIKL